MRGCCVLAVLAVTLSCAAESWAAAGRVRRYLVYPPDGSKTQLILGVGLPLAFGAYSLTSGFKLKYNYKVATNASYYLQPYLGYEKREAGCADISRWDVYSVLESLLDRLGMDGHACVLRAICEAAWSPVDQRSGCAGEVLHLLFTPSSTDEACQQWDREYLSAEQLGSRRGDRSCAQLYPECPVSLLELVSAPEQALSARDVSELLAG